MQPVVTPFGSAWVGSTRKHRPTQTYESRIAETVDKPQKEAAARNLSGENPGPIREAVTRAPSEMVPSDHTISSFGATSGGETRIRSVHNDDIARGYFAGNSAAARIVSRSQFGAPPADPRIPDAARSLLGGPRA